MFAAVGACRASSKWGVEIVDARSSDGTGSPNAIPLPLTGREARTLPGTVTAGEATIADWIDLPDGTDLDELKRASDRRAR